VCPACQRLVFAKDLTALAAAAEAHEAAGRLAEALADYRRTLTLLPPGARQHEQIALCIQALSRRVDAGPKKTGVGPLAGVIGSLGLFAWKIKSLLLGLTKLSTLLSMFVAFAAYFALWGGWFALGFVVAIYIHEMGHVAALSRRGIAASAPMFIPGLGAFVRLNQYPIDVRENARVGLAGPVWGAAAALVAYAVSLRFGGIWIGLARATAWLNLFNLLPIGQLDGGRGMSALSTKQRWLVTAAAMATWALVNDGLLVLLALVALYRAVQRDAPAEGDTRACLEFVVLIGVLGALCTLPLPAAAS
jgi:Zn-dependent protease